jgi:hypothetical protein
MWSKSYERAIEPAVDRPADHRAFVESVFDFTLPAFELKRVGQVEGRMAADGIVEAVNVTPIAFAASIRLWKMVRQTSSGLRVLRNVSTMASSKQFPLPDIEIDSA